MTCYLNPSFSILYFSEQSYLHQWMSVPTHGTALSIREFSNITASDPLRGQNLALIHPGHSGVGAQTNNFEIGKKAIWK